MSLARATKFDYKIMPYLICNTTSYQHSDFEKPVSAHKSTDYRTSTGTYHAYTPPFPQDYDTRVKTPRVNIEHPILKNDFYLTENMRNYQAKKSVKDPYAPLQPNSINKVHYFRNFEEKLFQNPPSPVAPGKSETEDEYYRKYCAREARTVFPPNPYRECEIKAFGRDEQPPIRPEDTSYSKLADIYLTTNRATFVPHSEKQQNGIARKNIITYYDASGVPRGGKGYGPREDINVEPLVIRRNFPVPPVNTLKPKDTDIFPKFLQNTYKSETKDEFRIQTKSDLYPYIFDSGELFREALPNGTAWQTLSPPAMYCTEYCHCGTGWPVRSVIEFTTPKKQYTHNLPDCD